MHIDSIPPGARVIVLDDVLATGGTARAKIELVERLGGVVVGALFVIELSFLHGRERIAGNRRARADRLQLKPIVRPPPAVILYRTPRPAP